VTLHWSAARFGACSSLERTISTTLHSATSEIQFIQPASPKPLGPRGPFSAARLVGLADQSGRYGDRRDPVTVSSASVGPRPFCGDRALASAARRSSEDSRRLPGPPRCFDARSTAPFRTEATQVPGRQTQHLRGLTLRRPPLDHARKPGVQQQPRSLRGRYVDCGARDRHHLHHGARIRLPIRADRSTDPKTTV